MDFTALTRAPASCCPHTAEGQEALGELDAAVTAAQRAADRLGSVESARSDESMQALRGRFAEHQRSRAVKDFLELTA